MNCRTCPAEIRPTSKSGYCMSCWRKHGWAKHVHGNEETRQKRVKALKAVYMRDPEYKARARERCRELSRDPAVLAKRSEAAKRRRIWEEGWQHITAESRAKGGKTMSATKLAWCPAELRDEYRYLTRTKHYRAAEAKEIILAQHEAAMRRFIRGAING